MEKEKIGFTKEQRIFMEENNIDSDNLVQVFEKTDEMLIKKGFDENYNPTEIGVMCESILDTLVDMGF